MSLKSPIILPTYINTKNPTIISLKGQRDILGPSLEKATDKYLYIGRNCNMGGWALPKSKWANPFTTKQYPIEEVILKYKQHILGNKELFNSLKELEGKILCCWCKPSSCHGDILIELFEEHVSLSNNKVILKINKKK